MVPGTKVLHTLLLVGFMQGVIVLPECCFFPTGA